MSAKAATNQIREHVTSYNAIGRPSTLLVILFLRHELNIDIFFSLSPVYAITQRNFSKSTFANNNKKTIYHRSPSTSRDEQRQPAAPDDDDDDTQFHDFDTPDPSNPDHYYYSSVRGHQYYACGTQWTFNHHFDGDEYPALSGSVCDIDLRPK